jgi:predicted DNA-binding transcriptional regulator AlpA
MYRRLLESHLEVVKRKEFRKITGMSRATEWRHAQKGTLPDYVVVEGKTLGYAKQSVLKWIKENDKVYTSKSK